MGTVAKKAEVVVVANPFDASLVKFDYTEARIKELVKEAEDVDMTDLEAVKESHKVMQKIRTTISNQGLDARRQIKSVAAEVQVREDKYLDLAAPTEAKLKKVIDDDKEAKLLEARKELLPMKRDQLNLLEHIREVKDEEILAMDDKQWVAFYQDQMSVNSTEVQRLADEKAKEAEVEEVAEEAKSQGIEEGKKQAKIDAKEKEEKKAKAKAKAQEELEENKKYKAFLEKNNYNAKTDIFQGSIKEGGEVKMYRLVATLKIKK